MRNGIKLGIGILLLLVLNACKSDKYRSNRFAGTYEITKYTREIWDSTGKVKSVELPCKYVLYLSANDNEFGNAPGKCDTSGTEPAFLQVLDMKNFGGLARFTFEWNLGTSDNKRLSLIKENGLAANSVILNVDRNAAGRVKAFTYYYLNPDGSYFYDIYEVKVRR